MSGARTGGDEPQAGHARGLAANPIAYWLVGGVVDKSPSVFDQAFAELSDIGFTAVKADVPAEMDADRYRAWLDSYGLKPAISTIGLPFRDGHAGIDDSDALKRFAANQTALGLSDTMVIAPMTDARKERPAIGVDHTPAQLEQTTENLAACVELLRAEGLRSGIHQHGGSLVETEQELRHVLAEVPGLLLAPDTGHMTWCGIDPVAMITEHADEVIGVHLKDVFPDYLPDAEGNRPRSTLSYHDMGESGRLWAEPGLGIVDLVGALNALPDDFSGWVMVEVDVPSVASRRQSHQMSFDWARRTVPHLVGAGH